MTAEGDCCDRPHARGVCRRDLLKWGVLAGFLAGCSADQKPTTVPISEPIAAPTSKPTTTPTSKATVPPTIAPTPRPTAIPTYSAEDFSRMAYCGIRCWVGCPERAYPEKCKGCKSQGGKLGHYCEICSIRKCASEKQVLTCAHCDAYPSCEVDTWKRYPVLRRKIDQIRSDLQAQS
jgi:hypothetical protein